jgi:hypothetical protein
LPPVACSYLPLTAHWSLEGGLWTSSWFTGLFGTLAAVGQLQAGWRATAPPKAASKPAELAASAEKPTAIAAAEESSVAVAAGEVESKHEVRLAVLLLIVDGSWRLILFLARTQKIE